MGKLSEMPEIVDVAKDLLAHRPDCHESAQVIYNKLMSMSQNMCVYVMLAAYEAQKEEAERHKKALEVYLNNR